MKTAVIISDTHKNFRALDKLLPIMLENDLVIHLGDHESDILSYRKELSNKIISVKGNCDGDGEERVLDIDGVRILIAHGDRYGVKSSLLNLSFRAKELGVKVVFYGHTHQMSEDIIDGITFINPGAMTAFGEKSYCYAIFHNGKVTTKLVTFD